MWKLFFLNEICLKRFGEIERDIFWKRTYGGCESYSGVNHSFWKIVKESTQAYKTSNY